MSINISSKTDYSTLLSSLTSTDSSDTSSLLSDYAAIKNGSYQKLMKAYYGSKSSSSSAKTTLSDESKKELTDIKSAAADLKTVSESLSADSTYSDMKSFVEKYNSLIKAADDTDNSSIEGKTTRLIKNTIANSNLLNSIGITINEDSTLSIDEEAFNNAGVSVKKALLSGGGSFADMLSNQASLIKSAASSALNKGSGSYSSSGSYVSDIVNGTYDTTT